MRFKIGEHGATTTGIFYSSAPISSASMCGDPLETFTCVSVRKAKEWAGGSRDNVIMKGFLGNHIVA